MSPTSTARIRRNAKDARQGNSPTAKNSSTRRTVALIGLSLSARVKSLYLPISKTWISSFAPNAGPFPPSFPPSFPRPSSLHVNRCTHRHEWFIRYGKFMYGKFMEASRYRGIALVLGFDLLVFQYPTHEHNWVIIKWKGSPSRYMYRKCLG